MSAATEGPNHELFVKVLAQIEREPEKWRQEMWATQAPCGTSYCFAGHAVVLSGYEFDFARQREYTPDVERLETDLLRGRVAGTGSTLARDLLGISRDQAFGLATATTDVQGLFEAANTLDDLYRISADILGLDEQVLRDKVAAEVQS